MDKIKSSYCVIEVLDPPYTDFDRYVCVPSSWVSLPETKADTAVVKFPTEHLSDIKKRIRRKEECSADWNTFRATILYTAVSYDLAQKFMKSYRAEGVFKDNCARNSRDEVASSSFNKTPSNATLSSNINKPNPFVALSCEVLHPAVKQMKVEKPMKRCFNKKPSKKQIKVNLSAKSDKFKNYFTRQARRTTQSLKKLSPAAAELSLHQNNETQVQSKEQTNDCIDQNAYSNSTNPSELILSPTLGLPNNPMYLKRLVNSLKKINEEHLEFYKIVDEMQNICGTSCELLEPMVNLIVTFNDLSQTAILAAKKVTSEDAKEEQNETFKIDPLKSIVRNIPIYPPEKENVRKIGEKEIICNNSCEKRTNTIKNDVNDSGKNETASLNNVLQSRKFILPKEYDKNDSRWTLKHLQKKKGLVELMPGSGVYIDAIKLSNCKRIAKDSKMLARMLLMEVFSENALKTCSLTGQRCNIFHNETETRPGLDEHAKNVLLNFVEEFSNEKNWLKVDNLFLCNTLRSKLQEMRAKARKESQKQVK